MLAAINLLKIPFLYRFFNRIPFAEPNITMHGITDCYLFFNDSGVSFRKKKRLYWLWKCSIIFSPEYFLINECNLYVKEMEYKTRFILCTMPNFTSVELNACGMYTSIIGRLLDKRFLSLISTIVTSCFILRNDFVSSSTTISVAAPILAGIEV